MVSKFLIGDGYIKRSNLIAFVYINGRRNFRYILLVHSLMPFLDEVVRKP